MTNYGIGRNQDTGSGAENTALNFLRQQAETYRHNQDTMQSVADACGFTVPQARALIEASAREGGGRQWAR